jgi:hypothetical protein
MKKEWKLPVKIWFMMKIEKPKPEIMKRDQNTKIKSLENRLSCSSLIFKGWKTAILANPHHFSFQILSFFTKWIQWLSFHFFIPILVVSGDISRPSRIISITFSRKFRVTIVAFHVEMVSKKNLACAQVEEH